MTITVRLPVTFTDPAGLPLLPYVPVVTTASHRYRSTGLNDTNTNWANSIGARAAIKSSGAGTVLVKQVSGLRYLELGHGTPVTRYIAAGAEFGPVAAIGAVVRFRAATADRAVFATSAPLYGVKRRASKRIAFATAGGTNDVEHPTVVPDELWATVLLSVHDDGDTSLTVNGVSRRFAAATSPGATQLDIGFAVGHGTAADFIDLTVWPTHMGRGKDFDTEMRALYPALAWS